MTYKEVTILQFQQLHSAIRHHGENVYELGMEILNIFEGMERAESSQMSVNDFNKRLEKYQFLNEELPSDHWVKEFKLGQDLFKVHQTPDKWNVGQYVSISQLTKDQDKIIDNLHLILAVMCSKDEDVRDLSIRFQNELSISIAYPIALFFCAVMLMLPKDILHSLRVQAELVGSQSNGVGMTL